MFNERRMDSPLITSGVDNIGFFELSPLPVRIEVYIHVHVCNMSVVCPCSCIYIEAHCRAAYIVYHVCVQCICMCVPVYACVHASVHACD